MVEVDGQSEVTPETEELVDKVWITHGQIAHNAALADAFLYEAFHHYAGCKREMSRAIFFTVDAVAGHMALVSRAAAVAGADKATLALIQDLGEAVRQTARHRNDFAHSFLVFHNLLGIDDHIKVIKPKSGKPGGERVTEASLKKAREDSSQLLTKATQRYEALCLMLGIPLRVSF